jgi:hypothetical protein
MILWGKKGNKECWIWDDFEDQHMYDEMPQGSRWMKTMIVE